MRDLDRPGTPSEECGSRTSILFVSKERVRGGNDKGFVIGGGSFWRSGRLQVQEDW